MEDIPLKNTRQANGVKIRKIAILIVAALLITGAIISVFYLINQSSSNKEAEITPTPTLNTAPPTPTPTPAISRESVKIQILNGTGTPGQAGSVATTLENAGFASDNIETGNAPDKLTTGTIACKTGFEDTAAEIKSLLDSDFPGIELSTSLLDTDNEYDVVITTGGDEYEAPTSAASPTSAITPTATPSGPTATTTPTPENVSPTPSLTPTSSQTP